MTIRRVFLNILSDRLPATRDFYVQLLGFQVAFESDWFINLQEPTQPLNELGIWRRDHELVPEAFRAAPQGAILSFVVDDVDAVFADASDRAVKIVAPPRDLFYGQRSLLVADPNGLLVDISTPHGGGYQPAS